jgi:putative acetyltransferase
MTFDFTIRLIQPSDNPSIYKVIRSVFEEYNINKPGTAYFDECLPYLYETYTTSESAYFIVENNGKVLGGGGIFPTNGLSNDTCELVKMYLLPEARGKGVGQQLLNHCLEKARELGYTKMYLETLSELKEAIVLYEKNEFSYLKAPMGNSGHHSCSIQMIKKM